MNFQQAQGVYDCQQPEYVDKVYCSLCGETELAQDNESMLCPECEESMEESDE